MTEAAAGIRVGDHGCIIIDNISMGETTGQQPGKHFTSRLWTMDQISGASLTSKTSYSEGGGLSSSTERPLASSITT